MNDRQRRFAELVVQGRPAGRAYEEAGYESRGHNADTAGERLSRNVEVAEYLGKLREDAKKASKMTRDSKLEALARIAVSNEGDDPRVTIAAIAEENKMTGGYEPDKMKLEIEVVIGGNSEA